MATSLTLQNDASLAQGYVKVNGTTSATFTTSGITGNLTGNVTGSLTAGGSLTLATAQTATGTAVDFTGIPSWAKRITVMFNGVSTSGGSSYLLQLGTSSGATTTGYINYGMNFGGSGGTGGGFTNGFNIKGPLASEAASGSIIITNLTSNTWTAFGMLGSTSTNTGFLTAGSIALGGTLDRVRFTTTNGTDTFDAGTINIMFEG